MNNLMQKIEKPVDNNISYFVEWGDNKWEKLTRYAIQNFIGNNLYSQHILEIGTHYGKMACLFALMGAKVTGIDIRKEYLDVAVQEAKRFNVENKIRFIQYDGNLDIFPDETFDLVFTKSTLVIIPQLEDYLLKIKTKLKPGGKVVFIENGKGSWIIHILRVIHHRGWNYKKVRYFTKKELDLIKNIFEVVTVKKTLFPPIYLILGIKSQH